MGRKVLPASKKKVSRHFKLSPTDIKYIGKRARELGVNRTQYVEILIERDRKRPFYKI